MGILSTLAGTAKCPECHGTGDPTAWLPSPGYDDMLRQYQCLSCHVRFYCRVGSGEQLFIIRERVKALRDEEKLPAA